jgi:hypothetical protein
VFIVFLLLAGKFKLIKRTIHIAFAALLAFLLLFGGTSKELVHLFADHTDTQCSAVHHDGPVFEQQHHHCDFLNYSLTAFDNDLQLPVIHIIGFSYPADKIFYVSSLTADNYYATYLRGPPCLTI